LQVAEGGREQASRVVRFRPVKDLLILETEFERVLALHPQHAVLQSVVVIVVFEVSRVCAAPTGGRISPGETCFEKGVAGVTGRQSFNARLSRPLAF
jgi:hypothetical protein